MQVKKRKAPGRLARGLEKRCLVCSYVYDEFVTKTLTQA